jgi:membrane-associated phospholipid phosphatase
MSPARISLVLLLFLAGPLFAEAPASFHYLPPDSVDVVALLGNPPTPGTRANKVDVQAVLDRQHDRTPFQVARARSEATLTPAAFSDVMGPWFTAENLPITFQLLNDAGSDAETISHAAKSAWARPRPPLQDSAIHPVIDLPASPAYPSGHATRGALWAAILSQLAPDLKAAILFRGVQIGEDRVIAGVHFPTDVSAGRKLGRYIAGFMLANPHFQSDLDRARTEMANARAHPGALLMRAGSSRFALN